MYERLFVNQIITGNQNNQIEHGRKIKNLEEDFKIFSISFLLWTSLLVEILALVDVPYLVDMIQRH